MLYWLLVAAIILADQGTKWLAQTRLSQISTYPLIEGVFHLTYVRNTGAAFSILRNQQLLLIVITSAVMVGLGFWLRTLISSGKSTGLLLALSFILAGGIGNLIDRVRLNYVIDMMDFRLINYPVFNVADCFIVVGTVFLGWLVVFGKVEI